MEDEELDQIDRAFAEVTPIDAALIEAVPEARKRHEEAGRGLGNVLILELMSNTTFCTG